MIIMNRNTSPISPLTKSMYQRAIEKTQVNQYPDEELARFKKLYGEINNLDPENMELANGSDEWLQKLMIVYGQDGVLALQPDFFMYQDYANQLGVSINFVSCDDNYNFSLSEIISEIERLKPGLFILSNPHNPTSVQFSCEFIQAIADKMAEIDGKIAIDEAYIEFGNPNYTRPSGDHVILIRTLSKIYGLAGLRIGVMSAKGETFKDLTKINHPYPVNNLALNLANEFLSDKKALDQFLSYQYESRDRLFKAFDLVKGIINIKDSSTNYVFTYGDKALSLGEFLKEKGFLGRFYQAEEKVGKVVRYSIIELDLYDQLKEVIEEWRDINDY